MQLSFYTLDVFTTERFGGNPLCVVMDAKGLSSVLMQRIAREFNLSETVFVLPAENPAHSAKVRIFTPAAEIPFAGHPTVGTAVLLAELTRFSDSGDQDALIVLEQPIGVVRVGVKRRGAQATFAEFDGPKLPEPLSGLPGADAIASALGLLPSEIGFENHKPSRYSAGLPYSFVPVRDLSVIARAAPNLVYWDRVFNERGAAYVYCRETVHMSSAFHARMFDPGHGIPEDPATGSAAAAFAAVVHRFDQLTSGTRRVIIEQGFEMARPSLIALEMSVAQGALKAVRIGGHAVRVAEGQLAV